MAGPDPYSVNHSPIKAESTTSKMSLPNSPDLLVMPTMDGSNAEVSLSRGRKSLLLLTVCVCQYLDVAARTSVIVFVSDISTDLGIKYESSTWILNSYGITFGSFLLFWGRVSDLYSAKPVFIFGFLVSAALALGCSFTTNEYAFYILRAVWGVPSSATVPSAFRLICAVYSPAEVQQALAYFGLSAALANATGLVLGGGFGAIHGTGQMAGWRWFCRFCPAVSVCFGTLAFFVMPATRGPYFHIRNRWRHLDPIGSTAILAALLLLNIGLTQGAASGWTSASFLVPFCLTWPIAVAFFMWERRKPDEEALLPASLWRIPNMKLMCFVALQLFAWVTIAQLPLVERYQVVFGESTIKASLRLLPQGLAMCIVVIIAAPKLKQINNMRWPVGIASIIGAAMYIPWIYGEGHVGADYWKYYFSSFLVGSICLAATFLGANITIMTSVPPGMAGVAGALFQLCTQMGVVTALAIQAGLMTIHPGSIVNFSNVKASFWFQFGWGVLCGLLVLFFYKPRKQVHGQDEEEVELDSTLSGERKRAPAGME